MSGKSKKKEAKLASRAKGGADGEYTAKLIMLCHGRTDEGYKVVHRISHNVTGRTDCGLHVNDPDVRDPLRMVTGTSRWYFGGVKDVTCGGCGATDEA